MTLPLARSSQRLIKCNKEITSGRINVTKVQKLVRDTLLRGYDIYPNQILHEPIRVKRARVSLSKPIVPIEVE